MLPLNFAGPEDTTDYVVTGSWSKKTLDEGKKFTKANLVAKGDNKSIPASWHLRCASSCFFEGDGGSRTRGSTSLPGNVPDGRVRGSHLDPHLFFVQAQQPSKGLLFQAR